MGWGDLAKEALRKADEVYKLLVTAQMQIAHLAENVKAMETRLTSAQQHFNNQVWMKMTEFETRLREQEQKHAEVRGLVTENYAKAIGAVLDQQKVSASAPVSHTTIAGLPRETSNGAE